MHLIRQLSDYMDLNQYGVEPPKNIFWAICSEADCAPCDMLINGKGHCQDPYCMNSITVEKVEKAIRRFYSI